MSPVYKGGDRAEVNNYRPISLTCILSKLAEHIICTTIWNHLDENNIITPRQHGFRRGFSTTTQLLHVTHFAAQALNENDDYHMISFDFSKAFDKVPHQLLIHKLKYYKINPMCINWIENWLCDRSFIVKTGGLSSKEFPVGSGVPQGSVLGPLLFLLYINDMVDNITDSDISLYADDTLLSVNLTKHPGILQSEVDKLKEWANKWGMQFNANKCVHIQIGKSEPNQRVKIGNATIPIANSFKYLGVHIDAFLTWKTHISGVVAKSNRKLGMIKRGLRFAPSKTKLIAFKTIVQPLLEYASQVWSPHTVCLKNSIERIQRNAIKWTYFLKRGDSITECLLLNGISLLSDRRNQLDTLMLRRIEAGLYDIKLEDYLRFTERYHTRGGSINWHYKVNAWKFSFYNRLRDQVKVHSCSN